VPDVARPECWRAAYENDQKASASTSSHSRARAGASRQLARVLARTMQPFPDRLESVPVIASAAPGLPGPESILY